MARRRAYPRSRGDHAVKLASLREPTGLPPLARGPPALDARYRARCRPTPARAGTTPDRDGVVEPKSAYPRSRGDHHTERSQK